MKINKNIAGYLFSLVALVMCNQVSPVLAESIGSLEINNDQVWNLPSYEISGNVHINSGSKLSVSPASNITVLPGGSFTVNGSLNIEGSPQSYIHVQTGSASKNLAVITAFNNANVTIDSRGINSDRPFTNTFATSTFFINNSAIGCDNPNAVFLNIFNNSQASISSSSIQYIKCRNVLNVFNGSYARVSSTTVSGFEGEAFVKAFGTINQPATSVSIENSTFNGVASSSLNTDNSLAYMFTNTDLSIKNSKVTNFTKAFSLFSNSRTNVDYSEFDKNVNPFNINKGYLTITNSSLVNSSGLAIDSLNSTTTAAHNWWGSASGPIKMSVWDGAATTSQKVTDEVVVTPWLLDNPKKPKDTCCSNIIFIPGVKGSRLYSNNSISEHELWVPFTDNDVKALSMNTQGSSTNPKIYTKDIIGVAASFLGWQSEMKPYESFMNQLKDWQNKGDIKDYLNFAYDWRMRPQDIVENGTLYPNNVLVNPVGEILRMAKTSKTGKVSIITHSNGGLIAKAIVQKLINLGHSDVIDKVVTVAMPEFGAPQAITALSHGDGESIAGGFVLSQSTARDFVQNIPTAYNLLPSQAYFASENSSTTQNGIVQFKGTSSPIKKWIQQFGTAISSFSDLKNFLVSDKSGGVGKPDSLNIPLKLNNGLVDYAEASHTLWDNFTFPISIPWFSIQALGRATLEGLRYVDNLKCSGGASNCSRIPDREPILSTQGDGVVVSSSHSNNASISNLTQVNVSLDKSNLQNGTNFAHADLMRDLTTIDALTQIIHNTFDPQHPPALTSTIVNGLDAKSFHKFSVFSPVTIQVTDNSGHMTGISMDSSGETHVRQDIPNSTYVDVGEAKSVIVPDTSNYSVKIDGYDTGTFSFEDKILTNANNGEGELLEGKSLFFKDIPVTDIATAEYSVSPGQIELADPSLQVRLDIDADGVVDDNISPSIKNQNIGSSTKSYSLQDRIEKIINKIRELIQKSSVSENIRKRNLEKLEKIESIITSQNPVSVWYANKDLRKWLQEVKSNYSAYLKKTATRLHENDAEDSNPSITDHEDDLEAISNLKPIKKLYSAIYYSYTQMIQGLDDLIDIK